MNNKTLYFKENEGYSFEIVQYGQNALSPGNFRLILHLPEGEIIEMIQVSIKGKNTSVSVDGNYVQIIQRKIGTSAIKDYAEALVGLVNILEEKGKDVTYMENSI